MISLLLLVALVVGSVYGALTFKFSTEYPYTVTVTPNTFTFTFYDNQTPPMAKIELIEFSDVMAGASVTQTPEHWMSIGPHETKNMSVAFEVDRTGLNPLPDNVVITGYLNNGQGDVEWTEGILMNAEFPENNLYGELRMHWVMDTSLLPPGTYDGSIIIGTNEPIS
ncbi:unnamed protein product [marine sediment metagenome]|uniref:Uncharacterized protein n=1 Tax=marine sediment metagenome TaxID=412755 RepID=X0YMC5_9ZZZZ